jgi:enoyl-CoA hydratase/carnithine racemase
MKNLTVEKRGNIALVTINRPEKLNALNTETISELKSCFKGLHEDREIMVVILTGSGKKAFAAGADIKEITDLNSMTGKVFASKGSSVFRYIEKMTKPVIAAINGFALGGGCELAMSCHIRIASTTAKFGQPEINLGLIPGYGGTQRLPRLIGKTNALYLLLSGEMISAERAYSLGLVNEVVESGKLASRALEIAAIICQKAPVATGHIIEAVDSGINSDIDSGLEIETEYFGKVCNTEDMNEGTSAFIEKRKPSFKGR